MYTPTIRVELDMITIINKLTDTNTIAFEWKNKVYLCQVPMQLKLEDLDDEEVLQYVELFIDTYLIEMAA